MGSVICKVSAYQLGDKTVGRIVGLKTLGKRKTRVTAPVRTISPAPSAMSATTADKPTRKE